MFELEHFTAIFVFRSVQFSFFCNDIKLTITFVKCFYA